MKKIVFLITILFISRCNAQDNNSISLNDLASCTMKFVVNDVDKTVSKYGYILKETQKENYEGKSCDRYTFIKESNGVIEKIYVYKNSLSDPFDLNLKIFYYSLFNRNFNIYKNDLESDKRNLFQKEKSEDVCYERYYQGINYDYNFSICRTEFPNNPVYIIKIKFNNGAGLLRKK